MMNDDKIDRNRIEEAPADAAEDLLDITELVRSVQRREGNFDCFRKAETYCDRKDCAWRQWCLKPVQDPEKEGG